MALSPQIRVRLTIDAINNGPSVSKFANEINCILFSRVFCARARARIRAFESIYKLSLGRNWPAACDEFVQIVSTVMYSQFRIVPATKKIMVQNLRPRWIPMKNCRQALLDVWSEHFWRCQSISTHLRALGVCTTLWLCTSFRLLCVCMTDWMDRWHDWRNSPTWVLPERRKCGIAIFFL